MANQNFGRSYLLQAGPAGQKGIQLDGTYGKTALHIAFSVEKSDSKSLNSGKIQLWNLKKDSRDVLDLKDCMVVLEAGYGTNTALILQGNVVASSTMPDGADMLTEIEVADGRVAVRDTYLSLSYVGKVNEKTLYDDLASKMGVAVQYSAGCVFGYIPDGYAYIGKACNCLQALTENNGKTYSIQNGVLQIFCPGEPVNRRGYLISKDTGLLDIPKRITISEGEATDSGTTVSQTGWEIRYLLNGAIGVNDMIRLESDIARGYYRVRKITIDGDNLEGDWTCTAQIMEVTA